MWLKTDLVMTRHPKTIRLAQKMGISRREAVGLLMDLFVWVRMYAPTGFLAEFDNAEINIGVELPENSVFSEILSEIGWIKDGWMQKWCDYGGCEIADKARREPDRYQKMVDYYGLIPYGKKPEISGKKRPRLDKIRLDKILYSEKFEAFWNRYPQHRRTNKKGAWKKWLKQKCEDVNMISALENQEQSTQWLSENGQYIPAINKWIEEERWLLEEDGKKGVDVFGNKLGGIKPKPTFF